MNNVYMVVRLFTFRNAVTMDMEQALMLDGEAEKVPLSKAAASANQMGERQ